MKGTELLLEGADVPQGPEGDSGLLEAYRLIVLEVEQLRNTQLLIGEKLKKAEAARELIKQLLGSHLGGTNLTKEQPAKGKKRTRHRRGSRTAEVIERSKAALRSAKRPLERGQLLEFIQAGGYKVEGADPAKIIGRTLWESSEFIHIPKEGYWLRNDEFNSSS